MLDPDKKRVSELVIAAGICATFVVISATLYLGNYQDHNGDAGQYITHARNLIWGRPWSYLMEGEPAVLIGYPLVLALPTALFGLSPYAYALINSAAWAACIFLAFTYFRAELPDLSGRLFFLLSSLFAPFVVVFQQQAQPNVTYALSVMAAIVALDALKRGASVPYRSGRSLLLAGIFFIPAIFRQEALALYGASLVYLTINRQWHLLFMPVFGGITIVSLDLFLSMVHDQTSNFEIALSLFGKVPLEGVNEPSRYFSVSLHILYMITSYLQGLSEIFLGKNALSWPQFPLSFGEVLHTEVSIVALALIMIAGYGAVRRRQKLDLVTLFFLAHIVLISAYLLRAGEATLRYLLPVVPIFGFYFTNGLASIITLLKVRRTPILALIYSLALMPIAVETYLVRDLPARRNTLFSPQMDRLVGWLAENYKGGELAYYKTRILVARLDGKVPFKPNIVGLRTIHQAEIYLSRPGSLLIVMRNMKAYGQQDVDGFLHDHPKQARLVWQDGMHSVYIAPGSD